MNNSATQVRDISNEWFNLFGYKMQLVWHPINIVASNWDYLPRHVSFCQSWLYCFALGWSPCRNKNASLNVQKGWKINVNLFYFSQWTEVLNCQWTTMLHYHWAAVLHCQWAKVLNCQQAAVLNSSGQTMLNQLWKWVQVTKTVHILR